MGEPGNLTVFERDELAEHEATIERGLGTFIEVGAALLAIRDARLYRDEYGTFEDYCRERWGFKRDYANKLIRATNVIENLYTSGMQIPASEREVRPLTRLEPEQQRDAWQRAVATAPDGKITAGHVQRVVDEMVHDETPNPEPHTVSWSPPERSDSAPTQAPPPQQPENNRHAVHFSSATPEHYTPQTIIDATLACMEAIDLDPCSNSHEQPNVPAAKHFTIEDDGLVQAWQGRVYMNPPYGREIGDWVEKLCDEHEAGRAYEAIALVPARTDTQWWQRLRNYPVCFVVGRLKFGDLDESAPFPSAVFYLGNHIDHFFYAFEHLGDIWQRIEPELFGED